MHDFIDDEAAESKDGDEGTEYGTIRTESSDERFIDDSDAGFRYVWPEDRRG